MNTPLEIEYFISLSKKFPLIDVRSPAEFEHGHIPNAHNIPLFDNEERAKVGTAYKQISREKAIEIGYKLANPKLNAFISQIKKITSEQPNIQTIKHSNDELPTVLVHCWRGGMRSAKFAELLNEHGYKTHTLTRGYKAYRNFVLKSFESSANILIIGGETGSGKTEILKKIGESGEQIIDLENLAHHKGSAFGALGEKRQPTQEQFENELSHIWNKFISPLSFGPNEVADSVFSERVRWTLSRVLADHWREGPGVRRLWLEDESRSIGTCQLPNSIWEKMKQAPILRINIPKQLRIERLMNDYGKFSKEELAICIHKIEKRLGPQHAKQALEELEKGNLKTVADITLTYYDKAYNHDHEKRNMKDVFFIECKNADVNQNAKKVLDFANTSLRTARNEAGSNLKNIES